MPPITVHAVGDQLSAERVRIAVLGTSTVPGYRGSAARAETEVQEFARFDTDRADRLIWRVEVVCEPCRRMCIRTVEHERIDIACFITNVEEIDESTLRRGQLTEVQTGRIAGEVVAGRAGGRGARPRPESAGHIRIKYECGLSLETEDGRLIAATSRIPNFTVRTKYILVSSS